MKSQHEAIANYFINTFFEISGKLDYTNLLWENEKLSKYKTLYDFNQTSTIDKNMVIMESLDLNCSEIVGKSSKNCDMESSIGNDEFEKIQIKNEDNMYEEYTDYENSKRPFSQNFEIKEKSGEFENSKQDIKVEKYENHPLPDNDKLNFENINFSLIDQAKTLVFESKLVTENEEKASTNKKVKLTEIIDTPNKDNRLHEISVKLDSQFKTFYHENSGDKGDTKINLVNSSQKSTTTNVTSKTAKNENPSKLFSTSFQNVFDKYTKIKEKIKEKQSNNHETRIKMTGNKNLKVNSIANLLATSIEKKPVTNNTSSKTTNKNSLIDSYSKFSALDTFVSTVPIKSLNATVKNSINTSNIKNITRKSQNTSFKDHTRNFSNKN